MQHDMEENTLLASNVLQHLAIISPKNDAKSTCPFEYYERIRHVQSTFLTLQTLTTKLRSRSKHVKILWPIDLTSDKSGQNTHVFDVFWCSPV